MNGGPVPTQNSGYWPTTAQAAGGNADQAIAAGSVSFPLMPLMVTPSIAQYKACNERFMNMRMRFITVQTTPYLVPG